LFKRKYIPTKTITVRPNDKPFMNNKIRNKIRQRNRIHYKAKTTNNPDHYTNLAIMFQKWGWISGFSKIWYGFSNSPPFPRRYILVWKVRGKFLLRLLQFDQMINHSWIIKLETRSHNVTEFIIKLKLQTTLIIGQNLEKSGML
jgi:hypothetical protein